MPSRAERLENTSASIVNLDIIPGHTANAVSKPAGTKPSIGGAIKKPEKKSYEFQPLSSNLSSIGSDIPTIPVPNNRRMLINPSPSKSKSLSPVKETSFSTNKKGNADNYFENFGSNKDLEAM